ncbi:MAG: hypothetical protein BWX80_03473 [Candidatus Hydrogenedentes bacterium ADurb.Bin101]|nr:MAG: hypothetical protein BWX80_03473 [Candidatus Hydrogenedentes bacterium ADurb.Bin101]
MGNTAAMPSGHSVPGPKAIRLAKDADSFAQYSWLCSRTPGSTGSGFPAEATASPDALSKTTDSSSVEFTNSFRAASMRGLGMNAIRPWERITTLNAAEKSWARPARFLRASSCTR